MAETSTSKRKKAILVVSFNPGLADVRKNVLEAAGYKVIAAKTIVQVRRACQRKQPPDLVMIGYSLPPAEKRRVSVEVRAHLRRVPVLELYDGGKARLADEARTYTHQSQAPQDFLDAVREILN